VLYARKVFAVKKVFVIMVMRWDGGRDLASQERSDASRAPPAKRQGSWPASITVMHPALPRRTEVGTPAGHLSAASVMESAPGFYPGRSGFESSAAYANSLLR
jgi:hypothetical protein